jgi:hypothetical protein
MVRVGLRAVALREAPELGSSEMQTGILDTLNGAEHDAFLDRTLKPTSIGVSALLAD